MRSDTEVRENLEWLKSQCIHYKDNEADRVIRQLETLLWVLGHERAEATNLAEALWQDAREQRNREQRNKK